MKKLAYIDGRHRNVMCARYLIDVTDHQSYRPSGSHQESKSYFSNKHMLYGYKA